MGRVAVPRITDGSSVFTKELLAILQALWWTEEVKPEKVVICSDSADFALKRGKAKARPDRITEILSVLLRIGRSWF